MRKKRSKNQMIPILDDRGEQKHNKEGKLLFKKTKADVELKDFNDLQIWIKPPGEEHKQKVNVWWLIERFIKIDTKEGDIIAFELNDAQIDLYKELCLQKRAKKRMRINILKARQLGMSTFIAALYIVLALLVPGQRAVVVADIAENAKKIFEKYQFMYESLPDWIKQAIPLKANNAHELVVSFGVRKSSIRVVTVGDHSGRGTTCQYLHLSEVAFWPDIKSVIRSLNQTVSTKNPFSIIIYETTANGVNEYKSMYDNAVGGKSSFKAVFYPWYLDKDYRMDYWGFELMEHEKKLMEELHLDLHQIAWYRFKLNEMEGDINSLRQEYPSTPIEAFITTGSSLFPMELVLKRKGEIIDKKFPRYEFIWDKKIVSEQGDSINLVNPRLSPSSMGLITIFKEVERGHPYIVNVDPAMGGEDNFVAQVFDNHTCKQVAKLSINHNSNYQWLGEQIYCLCRYYNGAFLNAECNNPTGTFVLEVAETCGHHFIYQDNAVDTLSDHYEDRRGYKTKTSNREYMINLTVKAYRDDYQMISDWDTLCEMENFQIVRNERTGKEKAEATSGNHDDHVTSLFGIFLARRSMIQTTLVDERVSSQPKGYDELLAERRELNRQRRIEESQRKERTDQWI